MLISSSIQVCLHFPMDFVILMREYYVGANTPIPYFLGRTIAAIPYSLVFLIMGIIPYWMTGLSRDIGAFAYYCLVLFLLVFGSQSIGYFSSSFTSNPIVGLSICKFVMYRNAQTVQFKALTATKCLFSTCLYIKCLYSLPQ